MSSDLSSGSHCLTFFLSPSLAVMKAYGGFWLKDDERMCITVMNEKSRCTCVICIGNQISAMLIIEEKNCKFHCIYLMEMEFNSLGLFFHVCICKTNQINCLSYHFFFDSLNSVYQCRHLLHPIFFLAYLDKVCKA